MAAEAYGKFVAITSEGHTPYNIKQREFDTLAELKAWIRELVAEMRVEYASVMCDARNGVWVGYDELGNAKYQVDVFKRVGIM